MHSGKPFGMYLSPEVADLLKRATTMSPYRLSRTTIIERGIRLVFKELEAAATDLASREASAKP